MQSEVFKDPIVFLMEYAIFVILLFVFLDRNRKGNLKFVSLQSMAAERILGKKVGLNDSPSSILFLEDGILYQKSNAILKISAHLCFPWNIFPLFKWVPGCIRDYIYDWIARNRYRWFGRLEICRIPDPSLKHRFLDD
ncbi:PF04134 family protein [Leptospira interrogans serovar Australis str. 200703203]|uniref:PF04134 family protein n=1 Tax=Leptospira interrogans serovar Australis str. 200703203 TaxID=1085541 RepID=N1V0L5_LEPIR|nr:PF04134 family protein [Leptospira interrogans serovar Australis str. 200703203]